MSNSYHIKFDDGVKESLQREASEKDMSLSEYIKMLIRRRKNVDFEEIKSQIANYEAKLKLLYNDLSLHVHEQMEEVKQLNKMKLEELRRLEMQKEERNKKGYLRAYHIIKENDLFNEVDVLEIEDQNGILDFIGKMRKEGIHIDFVSLKQYIENKNKGWEREKNE
jgi:hypothetical protein